MLAQRVMTAGVLIVGLLTVLFYFGETAWAIVMLFPLVIGLYEWAKLTAQNTLTATIYAVVVTGLTVWINYLHLAVDLYLVAAVLWLVIVPMILVTGHTFKSVWLSLPVGALVIAPMWCALLELRHHGAWWVLLVMGVVWVADSAAYFAGRWFGRHKLAPLISPGKTWEGVLGALCAVLVYCSGMLYALSKMMAWSTWGLPVFLLAILILYLSVLGDLFESWMKRQAGVKDSGRVFPGHGGMLDRVDALTSSLPIVALVLFHASVLSSLF